MGIAKVTRNYQVTIPKDIRRTQDIMIGDTVLFSIEGNKIDFLKIKREDMLKKAFGGWTETKERGVEYVRRIRKEWSERTKRLTK